MRNGLAYRAIKLLPGDGERVTGRFCLLGYYEDLRRKANRAMLTFKVFVERW